jgi:hypothetical protein
MLNLNDKNTHYVIITANKEGVGEEMNKERNSLLEDSLFRRNYRLVKLGGIYDGVEEDSFLAFKDVSPISNNEIRYDVIELIDQFEQECAIVKYLGEETPKKVMNNGSEEPMGLVKYSGSSDNRSYFYNGISFSFSEKKRYYTPKKKEDFKEGMVIEYLNDNKIWVEKEVVNPEKEYNNMYKLLIKYNRIRCSH